MAEVKWIKINIDMFDDEKIKIIQSMPEGDAILVIWIKLITLAGKTNDGGYIYIAENMPYTDEMLAVIMNKPINTIRLALETFSRLKMIDNDTKGIYLLNFEKHQSLDKLEKMKEQNRKRVAKFREKQKKLECNVTSNVTVTQSNATDIDIEEDIEIDKDKDININIYSPANKVLSKKETEEILNKEFETIWVEYPNKQGKANALKSYIKARIKDKVDYDVIVEGLKRYLVYCQQNKDWYKPKNGSTWFNQQSWNDEYPLKELTTKDIPIDISDF